MPYLTAEVPAVACALRERLEDFEVEERLERPARGSGPTVWIALEKRGISTHEAARRLAQALGVGSRQVGYAGLKDARAVARQTFSVQGIDPERAQTLELEGLRVLGVERDEGRLKPGKLWGNRFRIRLRQLGDGAGERAKAVLELLERRGVPNWFGEQRFGVRGDAWKVGRAFARGDAMEALSWIAGRPGPSDTGRIRRARELFDRGRWSQAARAWPNVLRDNVRICRSLHKHGGDAKRAFRVLDERLLELFVSAWQAHLFNAVLAARLETFDRLLPGDLAWQHSDDALVRIEDSAGDEAPARAFELSPTGPLPGRKAPLPGLEPLEIESAALAREGASHRETAGCRWAPPGGRRPLRVAARELSLREDEDEHGRFLELGFELPSGAYATALLREIHKQQPAAEES